jgi:hypothetical protein
VPRQLAGRMDLGMHHDGGNSDTALRPVANSSPENR